MAYQSVGKQKNSHKARRPVGVCALRLRRDPHVLLHADPELDLNLVVVPDVDALHQPGNDHKLIVRRNQRPAVLFHSPLLLSQLLSQHGQLGFRSGDGILIVLNASPGQTEGGLGFLVICWLMVRILREKLLESSDSATTSSHRVSAIKFTYFSIVVLEQ